MAQTVDGYAWMKRSIEQYFRAKKNPGMIDADVVADGITDAETWMMAEVLESHVDWNTKYTVVDDTTPAKGTEIDYQIRRLFIEEDLGITDFARAERLWRVSPDKSATRLPISYIATGANEYIRGQGSLIAPDGEFYSEGGAVNALGNWEQAFYIINWNTIFPDSELGIEYHWYPPIVKTDWFTETDASGNLTKGPPFPRALWPHILHYAKWSIAETTGDTAKLIALGHRFKGRNGIQDRVRAFLGQFQTGETEYVEDMTSTER